MNLRFLPVLVLLPLASCASHDFGAAPPTPSMVAGSALGTNSGEIDRKLVRTGSQSVEVRDLKVAVFETKVIVHSQKGFIESSTVRGDNEADLRLRVPASSLQTTLDELAGLGKETLRRVSVDDLTREYIDLEAELTNLRALRARLRTLLSQAKNVKEALEVEKELTRVQTRLDSLESQLRTLKGQVRYSRISLTLERKRIPGPLGIAGKAVALGVKKLFVLN
ncbi:MAG: DUF4349 domain-containing protein [Roseibacillus sp.]